MWTKKIGEERYIHKKEKKLKSLTKHLNKVQFMFSTANITLCGMHNSHWIPILEVDELLAYTNIIIIDSFKYIYLHEHLQQVINPNQNNSRQS